MLYPHLLKPCRGEAFGQSISDKNQVFAFQMLRPQPARDYTIVSGTAIAWKGVSEVIAWKGEAFGDKNLGQTAKLIVLMLRPYSIIGLMGKG